MSVRRLNAMLWRFQLVRWVVCCWCERGWPGGEWLFWETPMAASMHKLAMDSGDRQTAEQLRPELARRGEL